MANIKKATLKELVERLEKVEGKVEDFYKFNNLMKDIPPLGAITVIPAATPIVATPLPVLPEVKHKCQTNTCESMETKEYQGKDRKMWLCESHKF